MSMLHTGAQIYRTPSHPAGGRFFLLASRMPTAHAFLLAFCIGIITFSYAAGDTDPCSKGNWSDWYGNKQDCSNKGLLDQAYACPGLEFITDMQIKLNSDRTVLVGENRTIHQPVVASVAARCSDGTTLPTFKELDPVLLNSTINHPKEGFTSLHVDYGDYVDALLGVGFPKKGLQSSTYSCPQSYKLVGFQTQAEKASHTGSLRAVRFLCKNVTVYVEPPCGPWLQCRPAPIIALVGVVLGAAATAIFAVSAIFIKYHLDKRLERFRGQLQGAGRMKDSSIASVDVERGEAAGCGSADADQGTVQNAK